MPGFYELDVTERRRVLAERTGLPPAAFEALEAAGLDLDTADDMIENVVGRHALPFAVALNFLVDGREVLVPMVTEEPSVVAAASNAAKMVRAGGGFRTEVSAPVMIGQVQLLEVADPDAACAAIAAHEDEILALGRELVPGVVGRGGGPVGLETRVLSRPGQPDGGMLVVHLLVDCRDAMGANLVNTVAEGVAERLAEIAGARVGLRILSNLCRHRTVTVEATVPESALGDDGAAVRDAVVAASRFAELDPYRATTHNKGIMNGLDAVLLATANDWRSAEAGAHAYAAESGCYRPLAVWRREGDALAGRMTLPLAVGTVGGALQVHPTAKLALALLGSTAAADLAAVAAAAGLASNLAALRALATDGIQRGHMSLHARVVARAAGARGELAQRLARELARSGDVRPARARELLAELQAPTRAVAPPAAGAPGPTAATANAKESP